jgi:hypothetical protein
LLAWPAAAENALAPAAGAPQWVNSDAAPDADPSDTAPAAPSTSGQDQGQAAQAPEETGPPPEATPVVASIRDKLAAQRKASSSADLAALDLDPLFFCRDLLRFSYAARGRYADQLRRWFARFDPSQFLVLRSEDLRVDPGAAVVQITAFLGVRRWRPSTFPNYSLGARGRGSSASLHSSRPTVGPVDRGLSPAAIDQLARIFDPQVTDLELLLGRSMGWELGRATG